MSSAKRAVGKAVRSWLRGAGPAPRILRRCDACGEEGWRPLERGIRRVEINARLADGRRADLALYDVRGRPRLIVQLATGSRLANRWGIVSGTLGGSRTPRDGLGRAKPVLPHAMSAAGAPMMVVDGRAVEGDVLHWRPLRERGLPKWRCRCAQARALPVDDGFSLRVLGCPLNLHRQESGSYASVINDCARCGFFVGIGYSDPERRRVSLYCSFGASPRIGPAMVPRPLALRRAGAVAQ
jgi:hypothetical protein